MGRRRFYAPPERRSVVEVSLLGLPVGSLSSGTALGGCGSVFYYPAPGLNFSLSARLSRPTLR